MSKSIRKFFILWIILHLVIPYPVFAATAGKFTSVTGKVILTRAGVTGTPIVNSPLQVRDVITTGDKSSATMLFSDDSTIVLQQNSKMEIREYMLKEQTRKSVFYMPLGRLAANVTKFIGGDNKFEVHSPTAVCGVRGTGFEFVVAMVGTQLTTTVTCTAGTLSLAALSPAGVVVATATIVAGQVAVITATGITVSALGAAAAGAGTTVATGTGTVATGAVSTGAATAAASAGAAAGTAAAAGISAGTIATGVFAAAVITSIVVQSMGGGTTTVHH